MDDGPTARQARAANPAASVWVTANAGSGKTKVLTDRVARLLLSGVSPQRILCLTYTRAGAAEMQVRLFARLGGWAMLPEARLRETLAELSGGPVEDAALARARRLFAQAIETPGGLRIQTIHSFCAALLRRFPLEAGVSPAFTEMDDRATRLLMAEVLDDLAARSAPAAVAGMALQFTGADLAALATEVSARRAAFDPPLSEPELRVRFGVPAGETLDAILGDVLRGDEGEILARTADILATGSTNDQRAAGKLRAIRLSAPDVLEALEGCLLTGRSKDPEKSFTAKGRNIATKATQGALGALAEALDDLAERVEAGRRRRLPLIACTRAAALHAFAGAFLPAYAARKAARGALDFEDLILAAGRLLSDPSVAPWVLWKLDGAIDHILVDEAQDTSPGQWRLVERLAAEITVGDGARADSRSLFVVGDRKQSIYSFQGADLRAFAATEAAFGQRFAEAGQALQVVELPHSFRSAPAILRLVDATFDPARGRALDGAVRHVAFRDRMPGRVDLWPPIPKTEAPAPGAWYEPLDRWSDEHHAARLAERIADHLRGLFQAGTRIPIHDRPGEDRPLTPGDVLILVRRRSEVFDAVIRALKAAGLPVAGADRLKLGGELAVKDLLALLAVVALPEDDLSLAAALRSPLGGWSEDDLFRLAHGRPGTLWQALQQAPGPALDLIRDLMAEADFLRPYELLERALVRHRGRQRLLARLGEEAEDGIDALLAQALAYEREGVPSLTGFLVWMGAKELDIKRRPDAGGSTIRVMTVHSAKGLEAPLVILPDTALRQPHRPGEILGLADGLPVWTAASADCPPELAEALADHREREIEEQARLLYVALTRAQSWLIVAAAGDIGKDPAEAKSGEDPVPVWYRMVREGMEAAGALPTEEGGLVLAEGDWPAPQPAVAEAGPGLPMLPDWALAPAAEEAAAPGPLTPSGLGGAKALGEEAATPEEIALAMERGTRLHLLLEHLPGCPPADRPALAASLCPDDPDLLAEAAAVLEDPGLAPLFAPGTLAEAPFAATLPDGRPLAGAIDRLVIAPDHVLAIDFKSNRLLPAAPGRVPEGILRQMGAYARALEAIFPGRRVEVAILWTRGPALMQLPRGLVDAALARGLEVDLSQPGA